MAIESHHGGGPLEIYSGRVEAGVSLSPHIPISNKTCYASRFLVSQIARFVLLSGLLNGTGLCGLSFSRITLNHSIG